MNRTLRILALPVALTLVGCGEAEPPKVPVQAVTGKVYVNGKPAAGAVIQFVPANSTDPNALRPFGKADDDGSYTLRTYKPGDGVPPGEYLVSVKWPGPKSATPATKPADDPDGDGAIMGPPRDYFRGKYANPLTSNLKVTVSPGTTELPPFQL